MITESNNKYCTICYSLASQLKNGAFFVIQEIWRTISSNSFKLKKLLQHGFLKSRYLYFPWSKISRVILKALWYLQLFWTISLNIASKWLAASAMAVLIKLFSRRNKRRRQIFGLGADFFPPMQLQWNSRSLWKALAVGLGRFNRILLPAFTKL